jgi:hypothetical protein
MSSSSKVPNTVSNPILRRGSLPHPKQSQTTSQTTKHHKIATLRRLLLHQHHGRSTSTCCWWHPTRRFPTHSGRASPPAQTRLSRRTLTLIAQIVHHAMHLPTCHHSILEALFSIPRPFLPYFSTISLLEGSKHSETNDVRTERIR